MTGLSTKSVALLAGACALFFAVSGIVLAGELQFADDNCAITFPDSWHDVSKKLPVQGLLVAYANSTGKDIIYLQRIPGKPSAPLNDRYIAEMEKGIEETGGGQKLSGKYIEVAGVKSYERLGTVHSRGNDVSTMSRFVPGEDNYYNAQALRFDGDASQDPEIREVMDSFRFLHPFVNPNKAAYQTGQLIGSLGVAVVFVVGFLGFAISLSLRRRPALLPPRPPPPPSRPPPLPPGAQ